MTTCVRPQCGRPTDGIAYACQGCAEKAREQLDEIRDLLPAARDVAQRQAIHGTAGGNSKPGSQLPINLRAASRLVGTLNALRAWAAQIAAERGTLTALHLPHEDPIKTVSEWLSGQTEWIRHRGETTNPKWTALYARLPDSTDLDPDIPPFIAAQFLHAIDIAERVIRGVASGPRERRFLGPCGAERWVSDPGDDEFGADVECDGAVYGGIGGRWATCKDCGARYDQAARIAERAELAYGYWYTAAEIAEAYGIPAVTIRQWRNRGLLQARAEHDGHRLYAVADVLALIATSKERAGQWRRQDAQMGA